MLTGILAILLALAGCPRQPPTHDDLKNHETRQRRFWELELARPLEKRVYTAPAALLAFVAMDNEVNGFKGQPKAAPLPDALRDAVQATLAKMPPPLAKQLQSKLIGIYSVTGLGSTGYTENVFDEKGKAVAGFIVFDVDALGRKANDWITWKESSPYIPVSGANLKGTIATPENDTQAEAMVFLLTHELGHVLAIDSDIHPNWADPPPKDLRDFPYIAESWTVEGGSYKHKAGGIPGKLKYYRDTPDRPEADEMSDYYEWLQASEFSTLYASTNPFDDFGDGLATYLHTIVDGKPWKLQVTVDGKELTAGACWDEPRCAKKRALLEHYVKTGSMR